MQNKQSLTNNARRTMEDNLAVIFMGIVGVFLLCHMPRILLSIHEMWTVNDTLRCAEQGHKVFPLWALIFSQFSHLLLVINSSVNSLIYCLISSRFRQAAIDKARKWGCLKAEVTTINAIDALTTKNLKTHGNHQDLSQEFPEVEMQEMVQAQIDVKAAPEKAHADVVTDVVV